MWNLPLHLPIWALTVEMWNCHSWPSMMPVLGGTFVMGICAFLYMWHWFSVVVFQQIYGWLGRGYICHGYMCILLYVTLIWCSGVPEMYGWLGGTSAMGICAFFYMWHWFGVVVFQRSMVNWEGTSAMGYVPFFYMWNFCQCSGVPEIYGWLGEYICQ